MGSGDRVEHRLDFTFDRTPKVIRREFHSGLNKACVFLDRDAGVAVFISQNPALALGDDMVAKFVLCEFIAPFTKCALGEFLDISFMHERYSLSPIIECKLNRQAYQALGTGHRHW